MLKPRLLGRIQAYRPSDVCSDRMHQTARRRDKHVLEPKAYFSDYQTFLQYDVTRSQFRHIFGRISLRALLRASLVPRTAQLMSRHAQHRRCKRCGYPYPNPIPQPLHTRSYKSQNMSRLKYIQGYSSSRSKIGQPLGTASARSGVSTLRYAGWGMVDADPPPSRVCVLCKSLAHAMSSSYSTCSMLACEST